MKQHREKSPAHRQYNFLIRSPRQSPSKTHSPRQAGEHKPNRTAHQANKTSLVNQMSSENISISIQQIGRSRVHGTSNSRRTFQVKSPLQLDIPSSPAMNSNMPPHMRYSPRAKYTVFESTTNRNGSGMSPHRAVVLAVSPKDCHGIKLRGHTSTESDLGSNKSQKQQSSIMDLAQTTQECTERSNVIESDFQSFDLGLLKDIITPKKQHELSSTHNFFRKKPAIDRSPKCIGLQRQRDVTIESEEVKPQMHVMQQYKEFLKNQQMKTLGDLRHTCLNKHTRTSYHEEKNEMEPQKRKNSLDLGLLSLGYHSSCSIPSPEATNLSDFNFGKCIGNGKFGEVYLARHRQTGMLVAIKKICKFNIKEYKMQKQIASQIKLQAYCNNSNIIHLYGFFHDELHIYLILEYATDGTLFSYLHKHNSKLSEREVMLILKEIIYAVEFLHQNQIAHRDIKPQNILLSSGVAKLCDFGWSARVLEARKSYCGTFDYTPPEILQRKAYDESVDLWCLGVLAYQLMTGQVPFSNKDRKAAMSKIINVDKEKISYPCDISPSAQSLIEGLLRKNPQERLRPEQLLQHSFFKTLRKEK